jgi:hypothetical protein
LTSSPGLRRGSPHRKGLLSRRNLTNAYCFPLHWIANCIMSILPRCTSAHGSRERSTQASRTFWTLISLSNGIAKDPPQAERFAQHQTGEQLWHREVVTGKLAEVRTHSALSQTESRAHHPPWRSTCLHPSSRSGIERIALSNRRRTSRGLRQSIFDTFTSRDSVTSAKGALNGRLVNNLS